MVIDWCGVSFQNIVVIPDVLQVGKLRFQFRQLCLLIISLFFQCVIFCRKLFQCRQLSIVKGVERLGFFMLFDFFPMLDDTIEEKVEGTVRLSDWGIR